MHMQATNLHTEVSVGTEECALSVCIQMKSCLFLPNCNSYQNLQLGSKCQCWSRQMCFLKLNILTCRQGNISHNGQGHDLQSASYHTPFDSALPLQLFLPAISHLPVKPFTWIVMSVPTLTCIIVMMERSRFT